MDDDVSTFHFNTIANLVAIPVPVKSKVNYEYQELGLQLQSIYGKAIWSLFYKPGFTEYKIREAHKICQQKGILTLGYLIGIVKKMP